MRSFVMSKYGTLEHLLAAKAEYYEKLSKQLLNYLVEINHVGKSDGEYVWEYTGDVVGEDIPEGNIRA